MTRQPIVPVVLAVVVTLAAVAVFNRPAAVAQNRNANGDQLWDYATLRIEGGNDLIWQSTTDADQTRGTQDAVVRVIGNLPKNTTRNADPVFAAGRGGWELVAAQDAASSRVYWFKRPAK